MGSRYARLSVLGDPLCTRTALAGMANANTAASNATCLRFFIIIGGRPLFEVVRSRVPLIDDEVDLVLGTVVERCDDLRSAGLTASLRVDADYSEA